MFTVKIQQVDRRGNYATVKTVNVPAFSATVAEKAMEITKQHDLRVSMYLRGEDVPEGWASRELEFSVQIWKQVELSEAEALSELENIPF